MITSKQLTFKISKWPYSHTCKHISICTSNNSPCFRCKILCMCTTSFNKI